MLCKCKAEFESAYCPECGTPHPFRAPRSLLSFLETHVISSEKRRTDREEWFTQEHHDGTDNPRHDRLTKSIRRTAEKWRAWRDWVKERIDEEDAT